MSRHCRKLNPDFPIHITGRCNNREPFPVPMEDAWEIFGDFLYFSRHAFQINIHSFVLMPNHFHMICSDPEMNLPFAMKHLMQESSREMARMSGRINRIWGAPYYSSIISDPKYFLHAYKYTYRNPVAAGLSRTVEEYPWSTLQALLGKKRCIIPLEPDEILFSDIEGTLKWLNYEYTIQESVDIKLALSKKDFKLPRQKETNNQNLLVSSMS